MRVRGLQTFLASDGLTNASHLYELQDLRIGIDAIYWLRTLTNLKDPLADAIGGLPPSIFGVLDSNLRTLTKYRISALFVFQGMQPRSHMLFSSQTNQQMDDAWQLVAQGHYLAAQHKFAQATSRITADFEYVVSHYLQRRGYEVFQAPYFTASQLVYFAQENIVDAVFGPPAILLFGIPRLIIGMSFPRREFVWIDRDQLLQIWGITEEQVIDACLLAGTEYCLTFPYLNLSQFHGGTSHFHFGTAIDFIKQAPLVGYMQHFPTEEMRVDHVDGYCICKCLIKFSLAMHLDGKVRPVARKPLPSLLPNDPAKQGDQNEGPAVTASEREPPRSSTTAQWNPASPSDDTPYIQVPDDFYKIVGIRLPNSLLFLMCRNFLSRELPSVLALGEWWDLSHPTIDSLEYRELLTDVQAYRRRALGLIAMRLNPSIRERPVRFMWHTSDSVTYGRQHHPMAEALPDCHPGMAWSFTLEELLAEMQRQGCDRITFGFCLNWHANEMRKGRRMIKPHKPDGSIADGPPIKFDDLRLIQAAVYFMVLENLGYFTPDEGATVFGTALACASPEFENDVLFGLELMKCGELMGDPLEPSQERPFLSSMSLLKYPEDAPHQHDILMLSRTMSLVPMNLTDTDLWSAPVDFDLAAFHSIVKLLKGTFRHLTEACLANLLLQDVSVAAVIPVSALDPIVGGFPSFMLPRNCMGIIAKHFLEFTTGETRQQAHSDGTPSPDQPKRDLSGTPLERMEAEMRRCYPCCKSPIEDLLRAFRFWGELMRIIELVAQNINVSDLAEDMDSGYRFLLQKIVEVGLHHHPTFSSDPSFERMRRDIDLQTAAPSSSALIVSNNEGGRKK